jgi:hypothetical protein
MPPADIHPEGRRISGAITKVMQWNMHERAGQQHLLIRFSENGVNASFTAFSQISRA